MAICVQCITPLPFICELAEGAEVSLEVGVFFYNNGNSQRGLCHTCPITAGKRAQVTLDGETRGDVLTINHELTIKALVHEDQVGKIFGLLQ